MQNVKARLPGVFIFCVGFAGFIIPPIAGQQIEKWADAKLPVRDGLVLWFDATCQSAARKSAETGNVTVVDGQPLDVWFDSSGRKRHLVQRQSQSQPVYREFDKLAIVRFDGLDDFLADSTADQFVEQFSIFAFIAPKSNEGGFRAVLATSALGKNDYLTGINLDQSFVPSTDFRTINVEGSGFGGAIDLMPQELKFGAFHLLEVVATESSVAVRIDDDRVGQSRKRIARRIVMDELYVGARSYSNEAKPPFVQGFFHGDIAEILVFDRVLAETDRTAVRDYLNEKHASLGSAIARFEPPTGHYLEPVDNPPPVQMMVPGFEVRELPLELPNINNVLYRSDGRLVALAYDGDIYLLSDGDGDGLEETAEIFWENNGRLQAPIGIDSTPADYQLGNGIFVCSKGKCSLIVDTDDNDRADQEILIASGWDQLNHGVDALGVAFDRSDGSVYFGLGTQDYVNAYMPDNAGRARYSLSSERGAILRISPDFASRETVCTGIRFPVALRFNSQHDLFCTDQEGATWLPNGNPFDELLHIQSGRHYGFPPRHPTHLPSVIDEPSVVDFGPQHQSTCGLNFNEHAAAGTTFGPKSWRGDAFVTGYSRGKLYRTKLVKTKNGYVGKDYILACLNMLAADVCVSPDGALVVAAHSGEPDWGSGPAGKGKLYKIEYADAQAAQPILVWAANEREVRIAFDRELTPPQVSQLAKNIRIERGPWLRAGDRFESLRPGYSVVQMQTAALRTDVTVRNVQITPDRRTLVLETDRQSGQGNFGLVLDRAKPASRSKADKSATLPQHPTIDLEYTLGGVDASMRGLDGKELWHGWLPHLDLAVAQNLTAGSAAHDRFWNAAPNGSRLTMRTRLDIKNMLRPATQPGSRLDFDYPPETVFIELSSTSALNVKFGDQQIPTERQSDFRVHALMTAVDPKALIDIEIEIEQTASGQFDLELAWHTNEDPRERPLPLTRMILPWASDAGQTAAVTENAASSPPELAGGSWGRGRKLFFGDKAQCSKCHQINGQGEKIGPDLSNLVHRDYHSVLRDITQPSASISPDHLSFKLQLTDGRLLTGVVHSSRESLAVGQQDGRWIEVATNDVEQIEPFNESIMPVGVDKQIGPDAMRDLLTFLLTPPPRMPSDLAGAPEPRSREEVRAVLAGAPVSVLPPRPLQIVLVAGRKDHGPGEHDYPAWLRTYSSLLDAADLVSVTSCMEWPDAETWASADAVVLYQQGVWNDQRANDVDAFLARGGGVTYVHFAVDGGTDSAGLARRIGLAWQGGSSKFRHGELEMIFDPRHPITRNFERIRLVDESYWNLVNSPARIQSLASAIEDDSPQPMIWCREQGRGRVFVSIPGHYSWTFDDPLFRILLLRGLAWSMNEPIDRFNSIVEFGANIKN